MGNEPTKRIAFIASHLPRKCGIATFTSHLTASLQQASSNRIDPLVVALRAGSDEKYSDPVKFEIRQQVRSDYINAADYINFSHVDLVSVQHEFGLFGGDGGDYLGLLLRRLKAPIITTLHTILQDPQDNYRKAMLDVCGYSRKLVTMNERGVSMLQDIYGVAPERIELIPHGIPDLPFVDSNYYKHKFGLEGRRTILTFGLLSQNKGLEVMLEALPTIVAADPSVMYIILGMTHPNVLKEDGESYRFNLQQRVKDLHLENHVLFYNRFVSDDELYNFLCAADVYVTPYHSAAQLTSGTLAFAVGTGKAVVSTPYWAAEELLAQGRGCLVPFRNPERMAQAVVKILQDDLVFYSLRRRAYDYGRQRTWPVLGAVYWDLFNRLDLTTYSATSPATSLSFSRDGETTSAHELPHPSLERIIRLSDDTGLFQHAQYTIPNRDHGYCTDDNARGVILLTRYHAEYADRDALRLLDTYLSFILHAQQPDGSFHNFMKFDRTWLAGEPINDAFGRVLWALGTVMALAPSPSYISIVKEYFDRSVPLIQRQFPRGMAYSIIGMCDYLRQFPGASDIKRELELAANGLLRQYEENRYPDWHWFEDRVTYDNGVLPHALFEAARTLDQSHFLDAATETCEFLIAHTCNDKVFQPIGCKGWFERGAPRARFDQQPIEAASMIMLLRAAYNATGATRYLLLQRKVFDWFLGANDGRTPLYDFHTHGCHDGLTPGGININQGAESTLSYLLSLLEVLESYALLDKHEAKSGTPPPHPTIMEQPAKPTARQRSTTEVLQTPGIRNAEHGNQNG